MPHSIAVNLVLSSPGALSSRGGWRDRAAEGGLVADLAWRLTIRGDAARPMPALSDGDPPKVTLAKGLARSPSALLPNDPTRGLDIDTEREIHAMLRRLAEEGRLVVPVGSETLELVRLCDRVAVLRDGRITRTLAAAAITEAAIVAAMGSDPARPKAARA